MSVFRVLAALPFVLSFVAAPSAVASAAPESTPRAEASSTLEAPATIDATGKVDVTSQLQSLINRVPDGGTVRLRRHGAYRVDGTLLLLERNNFKIDGNGARIFATTTGAPDRSHLLVIGGANLVIHDLEIDGANPYAGLNDLAYQEKMVGQHGIRLEGPTNIEIARVRIYDVYGDFVYIGRRIDGKFSDGVWIHDSVFSKNGRQGVSVTAGRNIVIERNVITDVRRATVDLEPNSPTWGAENVQILDNQIGPGRLLFVAMGGSGPVNQVVVARNTLRGHSLSVIESPPADARRGGFWIIGNTSDSPVTRSPLNFTRTDGVVVTGNTLPMIRAGESFVRATDVCGLAVSGNTLTPGNVQVSGAAPCGAPPALTPPPPPAAAGRPVSGAGPAAPPPTTTTTTNAPPPPREVAPGRDHGGNWLIIVLALLAALGGAGFIVWEVRSARRKKEEDEARRRNNGSGGRSRR
jgi:Right handed beta helix region